MNIPHQRLTSSVPLALPWHQAIIAVPLLKVPHSLSRLVSAIVGLGSKREYAAFYGDEGLFAPHSVIVDRTAQHSGIVLNDVAPKLIPIIGHPLPPPGQRKTQSVQRQQLFNDADDVRGRRSSVHKPKGIMVDGLLHVGEFVSIRRDNKRRAIVMAPIETEQGIVIARSSALRTDNQLIEV